jgi:hypothetical protein
VEEGRELFWSSFTSGKVFAQRQSFFDAIFTILDRRERDWLGMLLQLLFQTVLNFVTGLSVSVFVFLAQLPSLIWSYQPTLVSDGDTSAFRCGAVVSNALRACCLHNMLSTPCGLRFTLCLCSGRASPFSCWLAWRQSVLWRPSLGCWWALAVLWATRSLP